MKLIDISVPLSESFPSWPGDVQYQIEKKHLELSDGGIFTKSHIRMIAHHGTHIDAPLHFCNTGISIDRVSLDLLVGPCSVYEYKDNSHIGRENLVEMGVLPEQRILIKTSKLLLPPAGAGSLRKTFMTMLNGY